jgi:hypothetical protein
MIIVTLIHHFILEDQQIYLFKISQHLILFSMEAQMLIFLRAGKVHQIYYYKVMVFNSSNLKKKVKLI